jgi:hypothetical protein
MATQEIKIEVPVNWAGINLTQYLGFQKDLKIYGEEDAGYMACVLHHFCKVPADILGQLDIDTYSNIKNDLIGFMGKTDLPLQRLIMIGGREYGFEPNLSKIAYGAYLDISKYDTFTIDENWSKIMSILYRPVVKKRGALYEIETYKGEINEEPFLKLGMDIHFGALSFFLHLLTDLPPVIQNSLMKEVEEQPNNTK